MDSITQITLGAAVGEAVLGKKAGYRAAAWGAALGTFPDLDVLINPFVDSVTELYYHRNITHSVVFVLLATPIFGWMISKVHASLETSWKQWAKLSFWVFVTHILLDLSTTYGTQVLQPFSDIPYTTDSLFIIDPLVTVPLFLGVLSALVFRRKGTLGSNFNKTGIALAACYIVWGLAIKSHVHSVFQESFQNQFGYYKKVKTTPNGPTTFLWNGYIIRQDTVYHAVYSIFDESTDLDFRRIPMNSQIFEPYKNHRAGEAMLWFSRGYYTAEKQDGDIYFYDLRFGRDDFWLTDQGGYVWGNRLVIDENGKAETFDQSLPSFELRARNLELFWDRIWNQ